MLKIWNLLFGPAKAYERPADAKRWDDRTREEKRMTAPYALGWEEGYVVAYKLYQQLGFVEKPNWTVSDGT